MFEAAKEFFHSFDASKDDGKPEKPEESENVEKDADLKEALQTKLVAAMNWTNYAYNKAVQSGEKTARHLTEKVKSMDIKSAAENIPWLREFDKAQSEFLSQSNVNQVDKTEGENVLLPWHPDVSGLTEAAAVENLKNKILSLSRQQNTFLLQPPSEAPLGDDPSGTFINWPLAKAMLEADPHLAVMRYSLVPRTISEDLFWRNYFYRLSVVRQSAHLSAMTGSNSDEEIVATASDDSTSDFVCVDDEGSVITEPTNSNRPTSDVNTQKLPSDRAEQKKANVQPVKSNKHPSVLPDQNASTKQTRKNLSEAAVTIEDSTNDLEAELSREIDELVANPDENSQLSDDDFMYDAEFEDELLAELEKK